LNPLKYTDPFLSIILPLLFLLIGGIGLPGGAVYIERRLLRSRGWDCGVSLAGPAANIILAILIASPFYLGFVDPASTDPVWQAVAFLVVLQIFAAVLNLLPVPGLDGFAAIAAWMDEMLRARIYQHASMFIIGLFVVIWNVDSINRLLWGTVFGIAALLGVPPQMAIDGLRSFMLF
jgi:Zn-dependent protease